MDSNRNTSAWCTWFLFCSLYTAICSLLAALRITRRSDWQNFEVKKKKKMCLLVSGIVINSCLSACRRSTQRPGNSFVLLFLLLHYVLFKSETNSQVTRTLSPFSASAVKGCVFGLFFFLKHEISFSERGKKRHKHKNQISSQKPLRKKRTQPQLQKLKQMF